MDAALPSLDAPGMTRLIELRDLERAVSRQRAQIHRRIEYVRGTGAYDPDARETLAKLVVEERELSDRRQQLHLEIDALDPESRPSSRV